MGLDNLLGRTLEKFSPDIHTIRKLIDAAERNIADAHVKEVSSENRFDAAYKSIIQVANAALQANGYRALTSVPGRHQTMLQSLGKTLNPDNDVIIVLDALRKQRNGADYTGDIVPESAVAECITHAEDLLSVIKTWLKENKLNE